MRENRLHRCQHARRVVFVLVLVTPPSARKGDPQKLEGALIVADADGIVSVAKEQLQAVEYQRLLPREHTHALVPCLAALLSSSASRAACICSRGWWRLMAVLLSSLPIFPHSLLLLLLLLLSYLLWSRDEAADERSKEIMERDAKPVKIVQVQKYHSH